MLSVVYLVKRSQGWYQRRHKGVTLPMAAEFSCVTKAWLAHEGELRGYLTHRVGNNHLAEDLLQEIFVKAMRQGKDFCSLDNARAWLFQVARNALVDYQRLHRETIEAAGRHSASHRDKPIRWWRSAPASGACCPSWSTEDRDIIEQCDLNGMKQQDYAKAHGLTLAAVKSRLLRARQRMRDTLSVNCKVQFDDQGRVESHVPRK